MSIDGLLRVSQPVTGRVVLLSLILAPMLGGAWDAGAQETEPPDLADLELTHVSRRIQSVTPSRGPPGTVVTLRTGGLPAVTPVRIGLGATHVGFEELGQVMTTPDGELTFQVEIPAWAGPEETHLFIVFDYYFRPIALSDAFHVTAPDGTISREGRVMDGGAGCLALQARDGVLYALSGDVGDLAPGDRATVEGTIAGNSGCAQATTIEVVRLRRRTP